MTNAVPAARWLRCTSTALTAWCTFWAIPAAVNTLVSYAVVLGFNLGRPGEGFGYVYYGLLSLAACLGSFVAAEWQWTRMVHSGVGDHRRLVVGLLIVGVALAPKPFGYVSF